MRNQIACFARTSKPVLITGPRGCGKGLVARMIHAAREQAVSARASFVSVNCAAIPETLFESELFGHEIGAFTGAVRSKSGSFARAHDGTVFLDEIGDLPLVLQPKLLQVLEERVYTSVGGEQSRTFDGQVVAATNADLQASTFRQDLYDRLNVLRVRLPPLDEHPHDIPAIVEHLVRRIEGLVLTPCAIHWLCAQRWPGNVRELFHLLERASVLHGDRRVTAAALRACRAIDADVAGDESLKPMTEAVREFKVSYAKRALLLCGDKSSTARRLGIGRTTLRHLIADTHRYKGGFE